MAYNMDQNTIYVNEAFNIPLIGVDFLGLIDRGTNVIEIKPITLCNLKCKYCFVSAGDYRTNFIVSSEYIIKGIKKLTEIKGAHDLEIHFAPYGETLLYPELYDLLKKLWSIEGISTISMQSNGLLLTKKNIKILESLKLSRINISLNTLNENLARNLCGCKDYGLNKLLNNINLLLASNIEVLIAPVWFPGKNDVDIENIIKYIISLKDQGYPQIPKIGIQKYLVYKTGRKLSRTYPKSWGYFYEQLSKLEKKYKLKLKLGPKDFGIHKRESTPTLNLKKNDEIKLIIVSKGRWERECIGKITEEIGIKVLLQKPLKFTDNMIGSEINVKIIKANYKNNILTAKYPLN